MGKLERIEQANKTKLLDLELKIAEPKKKIWKLRCKQDSKRKGRRKEANSGKIFSVKSTIFQG